MPKKLISYTQPRADSKYNAARPEAWDGLVGLWGMLEGGGTAVHDLTDTSTTSAWSTATWVVDGLYFNGADSKIDLTSPTSLDNLSEFTIVADITPDSAGETNAGIIFGKNIGGALDSGPHLRLSGQRIMAHVGHATDDAYGVYDIAAYGVRFTTAATFKSKIVTQYHNGIEVTYDGRQTGDGNQDDDSGDPWRIGNAVALNRSYDGKIHWLALYNRVLTPSQTSPMHALGLAYWLEWRIAGVYKAPSVGTILPHMMQISA